MIEIDHALTPVGLLKGIDRLWELSAQKIDAIEKTCPPGAASPVFTVGGLYTARGWTEWTQGFQYGSALLQFDATGERRFLELGRQSTVAVMASHVSHIGVHDHGFNNVSTYGNLWRLTREGRVQDGQLPFYELALKISGAVQAARWRTTADGTGYIYSFNGPQSLFVDTIRSCRALAIGHLLGHVLMGERDERISLLGRLIEHTRNTARWNVYYGEGRDSYDVRGRTAHESIFNVNDGSYRCPSTQQGYSPFSTWTRGLAWAMVGYAEQLEFVATLPDEALTPYGGRAEITAMLLKAATATCDFYLENTAADGIPYWDTGAPGLVRLGDDYLSRPADPYNAHEPVDSSAAAIGAQGLLRLGRYLIAEGRPEQGQRYWQAGLTVANTLFAEPYLSTDAQHQGLILHSVYHRPNGWDHIPAGQRVPNGESSMWGDYHARELALYLQRIARDQPLYTFFGPAPAGGSESAIQDNNPGGGVA
ncbi:glycoside hydrolase family 88 protein [Rhizocola hellebori]|uniref:glycoside hydrolase family 88 protein n=1 Tax=Rhizocola hellebori TaxID=1392758 RepID=UPI001942EA47|nr:glycoside hydrolase family 88 protein [Rhizocola hellebori]